MKELEEIYRKRKQQILPLVLGFAAFFVIFRIVLPQWGDLSDVVSLIATKKAVIDAKEQTLQLLNSIPTDKVDSDFTLISTALPVQKDVVLIFSELNDSAAKAGVKLGGFSVKVGGVYSAEKKTDTINNQVIGIPFLNILVNVSGQSNNIELFADTLYKSFPLVEIKSINISKNEGRFDVNFFYKPITVRPTNSDTASLQPLTPAETKQIEDLKLWQKEVSSL